MCSVCVEGLGDLQAMERCAAPRARMFAAIACRALAQRRASTLRFPALRCLAADAGAADSAGGRSVGSATPVKTGRVELIDTQPPRGTRDFAPEDMRLRNWLFGHFREVGRAQGEALVSRLTCVCCQVSRQFGFEEWDAPVVESEALYTRKAGEEITQQARG